MNIDEIKYTLYLLAFILFPLIIMTGIVYWLNPHTFFEKFASLVLWCAGVFIGYVIEVGGSK